MKPNEARKKAVKEIVSLVKERQRSDEFQRILKFVAKQFHSYSPWNCYLILKQKPNAQLVAGLKKWNELGRKVKRGEKAIKIVVPRFKLVEKEIINSRGELEIVKEKVLRGFGVANVFDISQTEGKPLPQEVYFKPLEGAVKEEILSSLLQTLKEEGIAVEFTDELVSVNYGKTDGERIWVQKGLPIAHTIKVVLHEYTHLKHHFEKPKKLKKGSVTLFELEAETASYIILSWLGLESEYSLRYLASWSYEKSDEVLYRAVENGIDYGRELIEKFFKNSNKKKAAV